MLRMNRVKINDNKGDTVLDTMFISDRLYFGSEDFRYLAIKLFEDNKIDYDNYNFIVLIMEDIETEYRRTHGIWLTYAI